ncbi:MAG: TetR/AcrR family transcriptional regulator [Actinomycetota bacterium]|nr:TetR/AcrR family transcriptional regulator [Actinomycetota bacterium]
MKPPASVRAARMPADDRRASIVAAAIPLVKVHGNDVTTRQIAEAAGVAEGTLFRVFDDKEAIVQAVVASVVDPAATVDRLEVIDADRPIDALLPELVVTLQQRLREIIEILMAVRWMPPEHIRHGRDQSWKNDPIMHRIVAMLDLHGDELSVAPDQAARVLRLLVFAGTHPMINDGNPLTAAEIVSTLLDGVRRRPTATATPIATKSGAARRPARKPAAQPSRERNLLDLNGA